ncbi:MAG: dihydropteroate synthase [Halobacteria archaeon]
MDEGEAVDYLYGLKDEGMKKGFDRTYRLLNYLDNPEDEFRAVQVGGTNGKGSVSRMIDCCLRESGYSVGLYTSPDMHGLNERILLNDRKIRDCEILEFVEEVKPEVEAMKDDGDAPTFFEILTVLAIYQFAAEDVDVGVLEVGLGGRFDTTGVADPQVSAVTSVDLEHTDVLGDSIEDVAWEIGHVIPSCGDAVTGVSQSEALKILEDFASEREANLDVVEDSSYRNRGRDGYVQVFDLKYRGILLEGLMMPLLGEHQVRNAAVAAGVLEGFGVDPDEVRRGFTSAEWPGRFEVVDRNPVVVLDAAHNPSGVEAAVSTVTDEFGFDEVNVVFGAMEDKDVGGMARELELADVVYAVEPDRNRSMSTEEITSAFLDEGVTVRQVPVVHRGVKRAVLETDRGGCVLVTGSIYTVGEARRGYSLSRHEVLPRYREKPVEKKRESSHVQRSVKVGDMTRKERRELVDSVTSGKTRLSGLKRERGTDVLEGYSDGDDGERSGDIDGVEGYSDGDDVDRYRDLVISGNVNELLELDVTGVSETIGKDGDNRSDGTQVMGILNVTPDSFYDGGRYHDESDAVERAREMAGNGADLIDVGGESTRPGAEPVVVEEEIQRVIPVVEKVSRMDVSVSVDTRNPRTAELALEAGADVVNDVTGLRNPDMRSVVADADCGVVVMDSVNVPVDPNYSPIYDDVVDDVLDRLGERVLQARRDGVSKEKIVLDPGIGFGKRPEHDLELLRRTGEFRGLGYPVLVGCSRKSFMKKFGPRSEEDRLEYNVAANFFAALQGADYVRVHDVKEVARAVRVAEVLSPDR